MQKVIAIVGMHRSGTSLLCDLLNKSGVKFGENLLVAEDNPEGHFENKELLNFHKRVLIYNGENPTGLKLKTNIPKMNREQIIEAKTIFTKLTQNYKEDIFGWKDPRMTLFLKEWHKINPDTIYVCIYRHYNDVVQSLLKRDYLARIYPTRNFIKKFYWWLSNKLTIKRRASNYLKQWVIYNELMVDFCEKHLEDCIIISADQVKENIKLIIDLINQKYSLGLEYNGGLKLHEKLLKKNNRIQRTSKKAEEIYSKLVGLQ